MLWTQKGQVHCTQLCRLSSAQWGCHSHSLWCVNICCESHRCGQTWLVSQSQVYTSLASVTWADLTFLNLQNVMILWGALNEDFTDYHIYWILYSPKSYSSTLSHVSINFKITLWIRYYLLFTDEETGTERLNDLCKAIQLLHCRKRNQI